MMIIIHQVKVQVAAAVVLLQQLLYKQLKVIMIIAMNLLSSESFVMKYYC